MCGTGISTNHRYEGPTLLALRGVEGVQCQEKQHSLTLEWPQKTLEILWILFSTVCMHPVCDYPSDSRPPDLMSPGEMQQLWKEVQTAQAHKHAVTVDDIALAMATKSTSSQVASTTTATAMTHLPLSHSPTSMSNGVLDGFMLPGNYRSFSHLSWPSLRVGTAIILVIQYCQCHVFCQSVFFHVFLYVVLLFVFGRTLLPLPETSSLGDFVQMWLCSCFRQWPNRCNLLFSTLIVEIPVDLVQEEISWTKSKAVVISFLWKNIT